ncbi:uridine kinase family protein [Lutispora thermophila]|uniref:Uridine kinase n=1 Tax=Lutispora thermophila DSM 19022 TaxID=1122184 RepID=A0A1M6E604_9FIRM|nr:shikimate kinase [Lutispora thermophila]SHI80871.1 Uridine kinase [Lutispora thermophila DSM 19022]
MIDHESYHKLLDIIDSLLAKNREITISIDGNSGSGKSTLAHHLSKIYHCNVFHMDDFFLRPEQRTAERMQEVGGNVDYERFKYEVLDNLKKNQEFKYRIYDCSQGRLTDYIKVSPKRLNIVEGVYSMHPTLRDYYDLKIFLTIDAKTQVQRILERSGKYMLQRFINEWIPLENEYFSKMKIPEICDFVFTCHQ